MKRTYQWLAIVTAAAIVGLVLGYLVGRRPSEGPVAESRSTEKGADRGERKVLYWRDPMVPGAKFDKPGRSPFMDMELVPVYADEMPSDSGGVRIDPRLGQNLGIRLGKVEEKALISRLDAVGSVAFDERLVEVIQARVTGYVTRLYVKAPLEHVKRGQRIAEVVAPEWLAAEQEYLALIDAETPSTHRIRDAARQRLGVLGIPAESIRALEADRKADATTTVLSPIDGVVTELSVREGSAFAAGNPLLRINGMSTVWVNAQIPEAQASLVSASSRVEAHAAAWPGATFKGRVLALLPDVDLQTRTLRARVAIENPRRELAPGMFVNLAFSTGGSESQLVVPSEAVIVTGKRSIVIVARDDGRFDAAEVKIGHESDGQTTILSGLEEGQSIVLSGQFLIDSEASLKSALDRLTSDSPAASQAQPQSSEPREQP